MNTQLHLIVKAESGKVTKADAKKMTKNYRYELFEGIVSIPVISIDRAKALLEQIRTKSYSKKYIYQIEKTIFATTMDKAWERSVIKEEGAL